MLGKIKKIDKKLKNKSFMWESRFYITSGIIISILLILIDRLY